MPSQPLIALIHGTPAAMSPAAAGLSERLPEAALWNLLDDRLLVEANAHGGVTDELDERMQRLIGHAIAEGASAVLLTCSMYGPSARRAAANASVPVLAADESVLQEALRAGHDTLLVVATLESSRADTVARLQAEAGESGPAVDAIVPEGSFAATGDDDALFAAVAAAVDAHARPFDAVVLAQYSLAPIADRLEQRLSLPVLSGPQAAANALRSRLVDVTP